MLSGNIRKDRIIAVTNVLIAYSTTDLWLYAHTFLYEYITSKGARVKMGIVVGIPWFLLEEMQFGLSIAIAVLKSRKTKLLLIAAYFLLSSWWFIPDRPYRWLYWSVGSALYFYALDNFIALLKIRHSLKESLLNYGLVLAIYVFYAVFVDFIFLGNDPTELGMVLARYFGFRTLLIIGCSVLYYLLKIRRREFVPDLRRNMAGGEKKRVSEMMRERASRAVAEQQAMASSQGVDPTNSSREEVGDAEKNPAISNPRWEDTKGQAITKALVGDEVYLCADVTDIAEGAIATIKIVEKDADGTDDPLTTLSVVVSGGRIKCRWQVQYTADDDDADSQKELEEKGYTLPEYAFVVECGGATSGESGVLEVRGWIRTQFKDKRTGQLLSNRKYIIYLFDGSTIKGITDENGYIEVKDLKFGQYIICL